jgi:hypothetical protein
MLYKLVLGASAVGVASAATVTPVQKVIEMLQDMAAKGKKEKHEESVAFSAFSQWCADTSAEKENLIEAAKVSMGELEAVIAKSEADAEAAANSIAALSATIADLNAQLQAARDLRAKERKDFIVQKTDYEESIDALGRAMAVLKQQNFDRKQASAALLQVTMMSAAEKSKVMALLDSKADPDQGVSGRETANAYEFQSGGVIDMLETLEGKFVEELRGLEKDESNTKHQFNLLEQSLTDQTAGAQKQLDQDTVTRNKKLETAGKAKADLADTTASHKSDTHYLSDLKAECSMKSSEFETRQKLRGEEIVAIGKAVEILGSGAVSGNADTYLPSLVQTKTSFVQVRSTLRGKQTQSDKQLQIQQFLQKAAAKSHSKALNLLAMRVQDSPFAKVSKMISGLIEKLMQEANAEAEQNGFCTTELAANKMTREDKSAAADALRSEIDSLSAEIAEQTQKITELTEAVRESDKAVFEATSQRAAESKKNAQTVADAKVAQQAVSQALAVLKEFYGKAQGATALMQGAADDAPGTWDSKYTGQQGSSTGVVGMIEVIQSDFVRLETETASEEASAAKQHQQFLDDSAEDKALKEAEINHLNKRRARNESSKNSAQKELNVTEEELSAAQEYFESLKPTCMPEPMSWEERKAKREEEIQSLKEALTILDQ